MKILYRASHITAAVHIVEVERETANFLLLVGGKKVAKNSWRGKTFETFEEAKAEVVSSIEKKMAAHKSLLALCEKQLGTAKDLTPDRALRRE